jgi:cytoskeleton-associated protein 5
MQVGELVQCLKLRMNDSNKNLVCQALGLVAKLARAMGKPLERQARPLLAPAIKNLSDQKAQVRSRGGSGCGV